MTTTQGTASAASAPCSLFWIVGAYNRLVRLRSDLAARFAAVDERYRQRHALLESQLDAARRPRSPRPARASMRCAPPAARPTRRASTRAPGPARASAITSLRVAEEILAEARARLPVQSLAGADLPELNARPATSDTALAFARAEFNAAVAAYNEARAPVSDRARRPPVQLSPRRRVLARPAGRWTDRDEPRPPPRRRPDDERDAAERLEHVHGAGELQAVLLALLLPPGSKRALRAWRPRPPAPPALEALREHAANLSGAARLPWFELLLARMAAQPLAARQELLQATRRVMGARGMARPIDRLHWLAMRRGLGEVRAAGGARRRATPRSANGSSPTCSSVACVTAFLSRMVPGDGADERRRPRLVRHRDGELAAVRRHRRCAPPKAEAMVEALARMQTLSWMQRPVIVRHWVTRRSRAAAARTSPTAAPTRCA